ncbi:type IV pilus assembly protein PilM [Patescibacteria group bacterium]|nr:type IV pilus assembly protein PilM [Patescibacteria group bacterium]MBU4458415.1 type IV pilus assembly protein PilM [Patescibacteria group bacterium]MCG2695830.1 type IV pilus assembly protein PilM [Candidatus Portnoybacteria bacterium]
MGLFGNKPKSILGIDIGTSSIKVVQLRKSEDKFKLETYGEISSIDYTEKPGDSQETITREMLKIALEKSNVNTKQVVMAIPIFSSFTSIIEMPEMAPEELEKSIEFEARKYIPIPLTEVVLDWKIIDSGTFKGKRVLLIAVPKDVANKYTRIADALNLKINALELESFSFIRSLAYKETKPICVLDIGARATSSTIIDNGIVQMSHGLDIAGAEMTRTLASSLGVAFKRAEGFKLTHGIDHGNPEEKDETREALITLVDEIINGSKQIISNFQAKTGKKIEKLILNGGSAQMEGLREYVEKKLEIKTFIADPWSRVIYPAKLEKAIKEIGPEFSVAIGSAMREE